MSLRQVSLFTLVAAALLVSLLLVARELWPQRWQALNARIGGRS